MDWKLTNEEVAINDKWLQVNKNDYELPNGKLLRGYYVVHEKNGVNIVAMTEKKELLLVKQYRPAVGKIVYDFPAGMVEEGETNPLERAKKELLEETGYESDDWQETGFTYPAPHRIRKQEICYLAKNVKRTSGQTLDDTEFITYELVPLEKIKAMIKSNEFTCGVCISSLFKALLHLE